MVDKTPSSSFEIARGLYSKLKRRQDYIMGLMNAQAFESYLKLLYETTIEMVKRAISKDTKLEYEPDKDKDKDRFTANDYFIRLLKFYPKNKYPNFYEAVNSAINARNDFIHKSFEFKLSATVDEIVMSEHSLTKLDLWNKKFNKANLEISKIFDEVIFEGYTTKTASDTTG